MSHARLITVSLGVTLASVGLGARARADAIPGPPEDCAPGTMAMSSHGGSWCEDTACAADAECSGRWGLTGHVCREVGVCVMDPGAAATGPRTIESERGSYTGRGRETFGACAGGCRESASCERAKRCVPAGYVEPAGAGGGAGGGAGAGSGAGHGTAAGAGTGAGTGTSAGARSRGCTCTVPGATPRTGVAVGLGLGAGIVLVLAAERARRRRARVVASAHATRGAGRNASRRSR